MTSNNNYSKHYEPSYQTLINLAFKSLDHPAERNVWPWRQRRTKLWIFTIYKNKKQQQMILKNIYFYEQYINQQKNGI